MMRQPPRSTLFPTRRSSDLLGGEAPLRIFSANEMYEIAGNRWIGKEPMRTPRRGGARAVARGDRKSTRLNSSHGSISYAVFCLKKKKKKKTNNTKNAHTTST